MQTFLPYTDFEKTVKCLDYKRLGKQRVEAMQILNILKGVSKFKAWANHPAVKMWKGYETALKLYHDTCIKEWVDRGYKNTMSFMYNGEDVIMPVWLTEEFCSYHRATLLHKNFDYYSKFGWKETPKYEYMWG